jgi:(p)ppGpp synthase/HD superfamily hydrolase
MSKAFKDFCIEQHDIVCNQKYGDGLPYSFHLKAVERQYYKFSHLLQTEFRYEREQIENAIWGHDLIEDARVTYNDITQLSGEETAEIILCCTDSTGRNRSERKDDVFWNRLTSNDYAIFVKLCDVIANVKYSLLTNSSMYKKYGKEFENFKQRAYREQYKEMFDYLEKLLSL